MKQIKEFSPNLAMLKKQPIGQMLAWCNNDLDEYLRRLSF